MNAGTLQPGKMIANRYRVIRPIAQGGMGAVYEVEHPATGARRALKVMHGEIARDARLRERFIQEARVGATIQSDHVAKVIDAGADDETGTMFIVMDLLVGRTLGAEIARRTHLTLHEAYEVMRQTCHALAAAHTMGIIHRDLKPSNIFLSAPQVVGMDFMVRVLDFGIAKVVAEASASGATSIVGTPAWMAPEQTDPRAAVSPATDVWPLGLIMFRMLTGYQYFPSGNVEGASSTAMLRDLVIEPIVSPSERVAQYGAPDLWPKELDDWFCSCVAREPEGRFATAGDAFDALTRAIGALLVAVPDEARGPAMFSSSAPSDKSATTSADHAAYWSANNVGQDVTKSGTSAHTSAGNAALNSLSGLKERFAALPKRVRIGGAAAAGVLVLGALYLGLRAPDSAPADAANASVPSARPSAATLAAPAALAPAPAPQTAPVLRIHGSNTMGEDLAPALIEAFMKHRTDGSGVGRKPIGDGQSVVAATAAGGQPESIELETHGSASGFVDLEHGFADIGMSSRRVTPEEMQRLGRLGDMTSAACEHVVGLDGVAIVVNPANPLVKIERADLARIFTGEARRWSDVGGKDLPIAVYARNEGSGTSDTIKELLLGGRPLLRAATRLESSDKLSDSVSAYPTAIGYVGLSALRSTKPLMVEDKAAPLLPSPDTVSAEEYPLTRRLYLYTPARASDESRAFVDFALSDEGQRIVAQTGFVDLRPQCKPRATPSPTCPREYNSLNAGACRITSTFRLNPYAQPDPRGLRDLARVTELLQTPDLASKSIYLVGFADGDGGASGALLRSKTYADAIAEQLRARGAQVAAVKGFGGQVPIADDATSVGRERNRRVEVWVK